MADAMQWTALNQARVDRFEQELLAVDDKATGHPDEIPLALLQVASTVMRRRIMADPSRLATYRRAIEMLDKHLLVSLATDVAAAPTH